MKKAITTLLILGSSLSLLGQSKPDTTKKVVPYVANPNKVYEVKFRGTIDDINLIVFGLNSVKPEIDKTDLPYLKRLSLSKKIDYYIDSIRTQYTKQYKADSLLTIKHK